MMFRSRTSIIARSIYAQSRAKAPCFSGRQHIGMNALNVLGQVTGQSVRFLHCTPFHNTLSLVTGGSRGIGFAVSKALLSSGSDVSLIATTSDSLLHALVQLQQELPNPPSIPLSLAQEYGWVSSTNPTLSGVDAKTSWIRLSSTPADPAATHALDNCTIAQPSHSFHVIPLVCDVADTAAVTEVFNRITALTGTSPSMVVNCAGVCVEGLALRTSVPQIEKMLNVNVIGTINTSKQFLRSAPRSSAEASKSEAAAEQRKQYVSNCLRIVNVGSMVGQRGGAGVSVYAATKAAVEGYSKSLSREVSTLKGLPLTVNCIAPGYIDTQMTQSTFHAF